MVGCLENGRQANLITVGAAMSSGYDNTIRTGTELNSSISLNQLSTRQACTPIGGASLGKRRLPHHSDRHESVSAVKRQRADIGAHRLCRTAVNEPDGGAQSARRQEYGLKGSAGQGFRIGGSARTRAQGVFCLLPVPDNNRNAYAPGQKGDSSRNSAMIAGILSSTKSTSSSVL